MTLVSVRCIGFDVSWKQAWFILVSFLVWYVKSGLKELGKWFPRLFIKNIAPSFRVLGVVPARWIINF